MPDRASVQVRAIEAGIAPGFHDLQGVWRAASDETLLALLDCLTPPQPSAPDAAVLPAAIVRRSAELPQILRVALPAQAAGATLSLEVRCEDGTSLAAIPLAVQPAQAGSVPALASIELPLPALPLGYHRLTLREDGRVLGASLFIVAPARCHLPAALQGEGRVWGPAVQLYTLRSERNWGIGDFTDLGTVIDQWAARGAGIIALNPLHALFVDEPEKASPYSPSSRLFLNPLYLDVERIADLRECEEADTIVHSAAFQAELQALRALDFVDYAAVAALKLRILALLHASFRVRHGAVDAPRAREFERFRAARGVELTRHALWLALREHFAATPVASRDWRTWPAAFRDPDSDEVASFHATHGARVEFFEYLQWQCERQLAALAARCDTLGLAVGLYGDLAVSVDRAGSDTWAHQSWFAMDASIGAPPDDFSLEGQNWGLPPLLPASLRASAYAPFIELLRCSMRHLGALRIDHVMALLRLYWIPPGVPAGAGAYVQYPLADLLGILALESERHGCLVVGEDLGTVPDEIRHALADNGVLSYRLLYFEREDDGSFRLPARYPAQALVAASTHDLPTLAGFWEGADLRLRSDLNLFPSDEVRQQQIVARADARVRLLLLLEQAALLPEGTTADPQSQPAMTPALARALHTLLARTPSRVLVVQMEDVLCMRDQVNLPGTDTEHPNWRRKLALNLERWPQDEHFVALCSDLRAARPAAEPPAPVTALPRALSIPRATYRLQLNGAFTFAQASALVPYLARLGVSHVYCSPFLRARPGSAHGYDIVAHASLNPEIGSEEDFAQFVDCLRTHGMGQIVDVVPNHMGIMGADNAWWLDVLEHGPAAAHAGFFDIDWRSPDDSLAGRVLLPVLGDHYGAVLESGALTLVLADDGSISLWYHQHRFPLDPATYAEILERALQAAAPQALSQATQEAVESLVASLSHLPPRAASDPRARRERQRDAQAHKARLAALLADDDDFAHGLSIALAAYNGHAGERASFDALHALLEQQAWRLAYWRVAADEINYRRFFDINDLAGLRVEDVTVFEATHRYLLDLVVQGKVDGLRIDHPDGLFDPARYFSRLHEHVAARSATPALAVDDGTRPPYVVIEKILAAHESLPRDWAVHGTTGYDFMNLVNGLFVDGRARSRLERCYRSFIGDSRSWDEVVYAAREETIRTSLASELTVLGHRLLRIARADRRTRDFTLNSLRQALTEVVACFPVYRTYVHERAASTDRRYIDWAIGSARRRAQAADASIFEFLRSVLLAEPAPDAPAGLAQDMLAFAGRFQQFTAPVCAKGIEDTAFYRYVPLLSLNEVGGGSGSFGSSVAAFHRDNLLRLRHWPHSMLATSTHDTKRAEDVRTRIDVLSEMPGVWRLALRRWARLNRSRKRQVDGSAAPSRNDEYLLYQTLLGSFPTGPLDDDLLQAYRARIVAYMIKALREAKTHTSWMNLNEAYEEAMTAFIDGILGRRENNLFLDDFLPLQRRLATIGAVNGLAQTLLKLTVPGVPDLYRGTESEDYSLVDPDNRRPVDYARLDAMLTRIADLPPGPPPPDVCAKLFVTWTVLKWRREHAALFAEGDYRPLSLVGPRAEHLCAFMRRRGDERLIVLVPRLVHALTAEGARWPAADDWADTRLVLEADDGQSFDDVITRRRVHAVAAPAGRCLQVGEVLGGFPVAALWARPDASDAA